MVENGAYVNAPDSKDNTPLSVATERQDKTAVHVLLQLGATVIRTGYHEHLSLLWDLSEDTAFLELRLKNLREDPRISENAKRKAILSALEEARARKSVESVEILKREQKLYPVSSSLR